MPHAVSIMTVTPAPAPRAQAKASDTSDASSPTHFKAELGKATKKIEPAKPATASTPAATTTTDKPAKTAKAKSSTASVAKNAAKTLDNKEADAEATTEHVHAEAELPQAPAPEPAPTPTVKAKAKTSQPSSSKEAQDPQILAQQNAQNIVTAVHDSGQQSSGKGGNSSHGGEAGDGSQSPEPSAVQGVEGVKPTHGLAEAGVQPTASGSDAAAQNDATANGAQASAADAGTVDISGLTPVTTDAESAAPAASDAPVKPASHSATKDFASVLQTFSDPQASSAKAPAHAVPAAAAAPAPAPTEQQFAANNHSNIVTGVRGQLLPNGGSMQIRLDPADLGAVNISVHMRDGVMTATFQTSTDQASQLLSHSLGQLKTALESQGVSVGSLHVQQAPRETNTQSQSQDGGKNNSGAQDSSQQQEQQRREVLRKMWARVNGGQDPLDLVA